MANTTTESGTDRPARDIYSVSRLNREAKALLETSFPLLWIEGEISNLSRPASGHIYFSLKDAQAQIRCALFRGSQRGMACAPRDGLHVLARARVSLYEGRGDYQLIVEYVEEAGEGRLRQAYEQLKRRLHAEGLFDAAHKKPLPLLPRRIGVITSPSGAAIRDILATLRRRFAAIPVVIYPVPVQGDAAAPAVVEAIQRAQARAECDVLILARGGGSLEDLWAFNEEIVARAIHASTVPIVTGVGHETDITIADFVADARAATPTAAAELVSPDSEAWLNALFAHQSRIARLMRDRLNNLGQRVDGLRARLAHPRQRLLHAADRLAALRDRLQHSVDQQMQSRRYLLDNAVLRLTHASPVHRIRALQGQVPAFIAKLEADVRGHMHAARLRLERSTAQLNAYNPLTTLARGYAIITSEGTNAVLRDAADAKPGTVVHARLARGRLRARVEESET